MARSSGMVATVTPPAFITARYAATMVGAVRRMQQNAVAALHAEIAGQHIGDAVDALGELRVGQRLVSA